MKRGRRRLYDPTIPRHIDQQALPKGVYWDRRDRVWYTMQREGARARRRKLADHDATLAELHRAVETLDGIERDTLEYLAEQFEQSTTFRNLAAGTQADYRYCRGVLTALPTKLGVPFGRLKAAKIARPLMQRVVDSIGAATPTKANHVLRYARRLYEWGLNRGFGLTTNPARGVEAAQERKRRRLPAPEVMARIITYAQTRGARTTRTKGSSPDYLWLVIEIGYLCRLRPIEVATLTDANRTDLGVLTNRRKGSRDNVVRWTPRLRAAWGTLIERRARIWKAKRVPVPMAPEQRRLLVNEQGQPLAIATLKTAWGRLMRGAVAEGVIAPEERFGLHDLKRRGVTDTAGNRADKRQASGHRSEAMMDVYDLEVPVVNPAGER